MCNFQQLNTVFLTISQRVHEERTEDEWGKFKSTILDIFVKNYHSLSSDLKSANFKPWFKAKMTDFMSQLVNSPDRMIIVPDASQGEQKQSRPIFAMSRALEVCEQLHAEPNVDKTLYFLAYFSDKLKDVNLAYLSHASLIARPWQNLKVVFSYYRGFVTECSWDKKVDFLENHRKQQGPVPPVRDYRQRGEHASAVQEKLDPQSHKGRCSLM
jgi:hypothetical protein